MPQVFIGLAVSNLLLLAITATLGLLGGRFAGVDRHVLLAVATCMLTCLVQVVVFTYLSVTGRLISQAVHLGSLAPGPVGVIRSFKLRTMRCVALIAILLVFAVATGAAHWRTMASSWLHFFAVCLFAVAHVPVLLLEWGVIHRTTRLVERTLSDYRSAKSRQGGASETKPL